MTVSIGAAAADPSERAARAVADADAALYRAKALGRDRVVHHLWATDPLAAAGAGAAR